MDRLHPSGVDALCGNPSSLQASHLEEIAQLHGISRSYLTKIVMKLASLGWIESIRGRGGGIRLRVSADQLMVGEVLRKTETDFNLVECFDEAENTCRLHGYCQLKSLLEQAMASYVAGLEQVNLVDWLPQPACQAQAVPTFFG